MRMKQAWMVAGIAAALVAAPASATQSGGDPPLPEGAEGARMEDGANPAAGSGLASSELDFLRQTASDSLTEVELGQLAQERASGADVKAFAGTMVADHGKANDELKQLAKMSDTAVKEEIGAEHQALKERLSRLSGADFDRAYMDAMVKDHEEAVASFQRQATAAGNGDLKAWVVRTLPTLEDHLERAREIARALARPPDAQ